MTFTVGRRLGPNTRAPRGTPEGYIPRVSATGTIIEWVSPDSVLAASGFAWLYLTGIDGSTGDVVIITDGGTGEPITAYTPVA